MVFRWQLSSNSRTICAASATPCHYLTLFTLQESDEKAMLDAYIEEMKHHQQQLKLIRAYLQKADEEGG